MTDLSILQDIYLFLHCVHTSGPRREYIIYLLGIIRWQHSMKSSNLIMERVQGFVHDSSRRKKVYRVVDTVYNTILLKPMAPMIKRESMNGDKDIKGIDCPEITIFQHG